MYTYHINIDFALLEILLRTTHQNHYESIHTTSIA